MNSNNGKKQHNDFSSAMGDLKGLLNQEGIQINASNREPTKVVASPTLDAYHIPVLKPAKKDTTKSAQDILSSQAIFQHKNSTEILATINNQTTIPVTEEALKESALNDYLSDFDDDFDLMGLSETPEQLEEKLQAITSIEDIDNFKNDESQNQQLINLKNTLQEKLSQHIERSVEDLKLTLIKSMNSEIDKLFKF